MHKELSSRSSDETLDLVKRGVVSLRQAATERVRNGSAQELDLEEIRARIRGLTKQRGTIGYMSKRIVEVYMSRQGMQSLDSPAGAP
ncbi:unnamed protein product [Chondrus crispus]|uniref:Uncharacterized protein n=1 Tax=Chondrus crispus TaxID=2769 RepID=R7Q8L9_CHOCR|nr:unnamed protein product [Chondrus crispus]CDF33736.1 unnamed protein product [Chondrus crispus]|eukprot:XP_005713555.1 unnamed protein product [Chondrus crispus]